MLQIYEKPKILSYSAIKFETTASCGSFPGLGHGVDGVPAKERGEFPGKNNNGCGFPGKGPMHDRRP